MILQVMTAADAAAQTAKITAFGAIAVAFLGSMASIIVSLINRKGISEVKVAQVKTQEKVVEIKEAVDGRVSDLKRAWDERFEQEKVKLIAEITKAQALGELKGGNDARADARADARLLVQDAQTVAAGKITTPVIEADKIVVKDKESK